MSGDFFTTYSGQLFLNFSITGIVVIGFYLTFLSGQLSVAHQMFMSVGAYVAGYLSVEHGWGIWQTLPASVLGAALVGVLTGLVTLRLNGMYLAIATLALGESLVVLLNNVDAVGGIYGLAGIELAATGPVIVGGLVAAVVAAVVVDLSTFGLWLRSVADDELAAEAAGIRVRLVRVAAFGLGAAAAGLGGNLYAHRFGYVEPAAFGLVLALQVLLAARLGGRGFIGGPLIGTAVVIWLPELLRSTEFDREIAYGALLIAIVIVRPDGIVGGRVALKSLAGKVARVLRRGPTDTHGEPPPSVGAAPAPDLDRSPA